MNHVVEKLLQCPYFFVFRLSPLFLYILATASHRVACRSPRRGVQSSERQSCERSPTAQVITFISFFQKRFLLAIHAPTTAPSVLNSTSFTSAMPLPVKYCSYSQHTESRKAAAIILFLFIFHLWPVQPNGTYSIRFNRLPAHIPALDHNFKCSRMFSLYPGARRSNVI